LVELMVSITIGLIILAAVGQIFISSRSTYVYQEGMARVQESGRFGVEFLSWDIRMAGYTGCLNKSTPVNNMLNSPTDYAVNYALGEYVSGHAYTGTTGSANLGDWTPSLPSAYFAAGEVVPYTDVLVIRRGSDSNFRVQAPAMVTPSSNLHITTSSGLVQNDIVIVADCKSADIFQVTNSNPNSGSLVHNTGGGSVGNASPGDLSKMYGTDAEVMKLVTRVYYIGRRGNTSTNPPALFRKELTGGVMVAQELIEGAELLRIAYGEDTDNDRVANQYKPAGGTGNVTNWNNVVSVRLGLLTQTTSDVDAEADLVSAYNLAGYSVNPATINPNYTKRRRQAFNTTIQIRNP